MTVFNIAHYLNNQHQNHLIEFVLQGVRFGLEPWVPRTVDIFTEYDFDFGRVKLVTEARGEGWNYYVVLYVDRDEMMNDDLWALNAHVALINGFRHRNAEPISDNIQLGEN